MCSTPSLSRRCALLIAIISPALLGANFKCVAVSNPSATIARIDELEPITPRVGDVVQARGSGTGAPPLQYAWDFGDGTAPSPGSQAAHVYDSPGTYRVTLTVHDAFGGLARDAAQVTVSARVQVPVPVPHTILMSSPVATQPVLFHAVALAADADGLKYVWSFSDGQWTAGPEAAVIFSTPGTYLAAVTVTDDVDVVAVHQMSFEVKDETSMTSHAQSMAVVGSMTLAF